VNSDNEIRVLRTMHSVYLVEGLGNLKPSYVSLDSRCNKQSCKE
jgi:hypothetical protein